MATIEEIYAGLIDRIDAAGLYLKINGRLGGEQEAGYFDSKLKVIAVWRQFGGIRGRDRIIATVQDPLTEAITLAHEYGHYQSWRAGLAAGYEEARHRFGAEQKIEPPMKSQLSDEQRQLVLAEEQTAWRYGRQVLMELSFTDWQAFDTQEAEALADYRRRLEMGV